MQIVENEVLSGKTLTIDEKHFVNCRYTNCTLLYSGGEMFAKDSRFENCPLQFSGAANRTVALLASFGMLKPGMIPPPQVAPNTKPQ